MIRSVKHPWGGFVRSFAAQTSAFAAIFQRIESDILIKGHRSLLTLPDTPVGRSLVFQKKGITTSATDDDGILHRRNQFKATKCQWLKSSGDINYFNICWKLKWAAKCLVILCHSHSMTDINFSRVMQVLLKVLLTCNEFYDW